MHDKIAKDPSEPHTQTPRTPDPLEQLRQLLIGKERRQLDKLLKSLDDSQAVAQRVSQVLPDAIRLRNARDRKLTDTLTPTVQDILTETVKKDPRPLVNVLSPVIGAAIRKAVSEALRRMIHSLNHILEHSFSLKSLKWRLEAARSGRPFSEIALLHSLIYTVEQVFLIHRHSGLLLQHVAAESSRGQNGDTVSAMLTAIQDFVNDSFNRPDSRELSSVRMGELTLIIEQGPRAVIAGVVRGIAPPDLRSVFRQAVEDIHLDLDHELETFAGDTVPFAAAAPALESCLQSRYRQSSRKPSPVLMLMAAVSLLFIGFWSYGHVRSTLRWKDYLNILEQQPGLVVTNVYRESGKHVVSGLRDPMAADPIELLAMSELKPDEVISRWKPVYVLTDHFIQKRAQKMLQPPAGISLQVHQGTLTASGTAPHAWIVKAHRNAPMIAGVHAFNADAVQDLDIQQLQRLARTVEDFLIEFAVGAADPGPHQESRLQELSGSISNLDHQARKAGKRARIVLTGHADLSGPAALNRKLMRQRTLAVRQALIARGVPAGILSTSAAGLTPSAATTQQSNQTPCVTFQVRLSDADGRRANQPGTD